MRISPAHIRQTLLAHYEPGEANALARIVCTEMLRQSPADYFLRKDIELSADDEVFLQSVLQRLAAYEPIQQIQGCSYFYTRKFFLSRVVLIPRPETEELVQRMLPTLKPASRILDIGTGSGCIAVTLALELPDVQVTAWDISEEALQVALRNADFWQAQVDFRRQDVLVYEATEAETYDVIVSNPPYVMEKEKAAMGPNVLHWEPSTALFVPDDDPLRFYRKIGELGRRMLKAGGTLWFEINRTQGEALKTLLQEQGYHDVTVLQDISRNDRFIQACK